MFKKTFFLLASLYFTNTKQTIRSEWIHNLGNSCGQDYKKTFIDMMIREEVLEYIDNRTVSYNLTKVYKLNKKKLIEYFKKQKGGTLNIYFMHDYINSESVIPLIDIPLTKEEKEEVERELRVLVH